MAGAVSFRRRLGSTGTEREASKQAHRHGRTEDDQRPHKSGHPDHRNLIAEPAKSSVGLEKPSLHPVAGGYHDERRQIVHVTEGHPGCDASE